VSSIGSGVAGLVLLRTVCDESSQTQQVQPGEEVNTQHKRP